MTYCRAWKKEEKVYIVADSAISKIKEDFSPKSTFDNAKSDSLLRESSQDIMKVKNQIFICCVIRTYKRICIASRV